MNLWRSWMNLLACRRVQVAPRLQSARSMQQILSDPRKQLGICTLQVEVISDEHAAAKLAGGHAAPGGELVSSHLGVGVARERRDGAAQGAARRGLVRLDQLEIC